MNCFLQIYKKSADPSRTGALKHYKNIKTATAEKQSIENRVQSKTPDLHFCITSIRKSEVFTAYPPKRSVGGAGTSHPL